MTDDTSPADILFNGVGKRFGQVVAVETMDFAVERGSFVALLGPSGCGKTTCLRMIGGFEEPTSGEVLIRGQSMRGVPAYKRPVNMVFQHYALFPHYNVLDNIAYGLRQMRPRIEAGEITKRVHAALEMVRLEGFASRRIHEMSGGQQQRVALARALVNRPAVLLLDEPMAALDKKLRIDMQIELQSLQRALGITFLLVTHDQEEALSMSDRVCVMNKGRIAQFSPPSELYHTPADVFVAGFVGKTNLVPGHVVSSAPQAVQVAVDGVMRPFIARPGGGLREGQAVTLSIRPEAIRLGAADEATGTATVTNRIFLGSSVEYALDAPGFGQLLVTADQRRHDAALHAPGDAVPFTIEPGAAIAFAAA